MFNDNQSHIVAARPLILCLRSDNVTGLQKAADSNVNSLQQITKLRSSCDLTSRLCTVCSLTPKHEWLAANLFTGDDCRVITYQLISFLFSNFLHHIIVTIKVLCACLVAANCI